MITFRDTDRGERHTTWEVGKSDRKPLLDFQFSIVGEWTVLAATDILHNKLGLSGCEWLTFSGHKAKLDSGLFKEWLFNSSFANRVARLSWLVGTHGATAIVSNRGVPGTIDSRITDIKIHFSRNTQLGITQPSKTMAATKSQAPTVPLPPPAIQDGLRRLKEDYPSGIAFVMMKFGADQST